MKQTCPKCDKWMVYVPTGLILMPSPAKRQMGWRCGCGYRQQAGSEIIPNADDEWRKRWERANG